MIRLIFILLLIGLISCQKKTNTSLIEGFTNPPASAKPRVWWHWMNGNITKDGIKKDLLWMHRSGIGGFQNFDASLLTPQVVEKRLIYMTPEWKDAFRYTTILADSLKLEMAIAGSPGWSVTGGPWVAPADGMKKYVWTETYVKGGERFNNKLRQPEPTTGKFQNSPLERAVFSSASDAPTPTFYEDVAVIAFKLTPTDKSLASLNPKLTSSGGKFSIDDLTDGDLTNAQYLPPGKVGGDTWIQYAFDTPQTFKSFTVSGANHLPLEDFNGGPLNRFLKVSDDGVNFREVSALSGSIVTQNTVSIPATTARYFRFVVKTLPPIVNPFAAMMGGSTAEPKPEGVNVSEFVLHTTDRIDQYEDKAGFTPWQEHNEISTKTYSDQYNIEEVIDLSSSMKSDGTLDWQAPDGNWCILRFGYSLTGRQNHPASPEATGLEVDKLDSGAVRRYMERYLDMYKDATGGKIGTQGLTHMVLDSYEAGHMTWTKNLPAEFKKRRGYDIWTWVPVLTGRVVKSGTESEKFLWDFRKTIGEMIADNHYDVIGETLHQRGMKRYTESHEGGRIYLADGMDVKRNADIPMAAMWTPGSLAPGPDEEVRSRADIRESASVAHIYGQNIVAAESMTAVRNSFAYTPEKLKRTADMEMASGLNRFIIHTSVHQPVDDKKPGLSLGPFGQWFTRHETWSDQAKYWMDYLGRSSYMLQQGKPIVDILYYYGENENITKLCTSSLPKLPRGYEFDFVNATALKEVITAKDGKLTSPGGVTYNVLVLDESARLMTLPVLKKIKELAAAGVTITGTKPEYSPSLGDNAEEFNSILNEVWKLENVSIRSVDEVLKSKGIAEDIIVTGPTSEVLYIHRKSEDTDIYWLNSRSDTAIDAQVSFRVTDKRPQLWNPITGETQDVSYEIKDGRTTIPLHFDSWDAYFIVFRDKADDLTFTKPAAQEIDAVTVDGPWSVSFQEGRGAPPSIQLTELRSLSENPDPGIKYFSGKATYKASFTSPIEGSAFVDLGQVENIAEVTLNGKPQGAAWKKPFKVKLEGLIKGDNTLEVTVTNTWVNRLIGDAQPNAARITFTTMPFYNASSELLPSGLIGPVIIKATKTQ